MIDRGKVADAVLYESKYGSWDRRNLSDLQRDRETRIDEDGYRGGIYRLFGHSVGSWGESAGGEEHS